MFNSRASLALLMAPKGLWITIALFGDFEHMLGIWGQEDVKNYLYSLEYLQLNADTIIRNKIVRAIFLRQLQQQIDIVSKLIDLRISSAFVITFSNSEAEGGSEKLNK